MEEENLKIIEKVANNLAARYRIAYYDAEDIKQEIYIWSLEALEKYDGRGPLENFLMVNARNRCLLLKRSFGRDDLKETQSAKALLARQSQANLLNPTNIEEVDVRQEPEESSQTEIQLALIEELMPRALRRDYIKYKNGEKISLCKVNKIRAAIVQILSENEEL